MKTRERSSTGSRSNLKTPLDRVFVPLAAFCFEQFSCGKTIEVRRRLGSFQFKHVRVGRRVELRRGYSGPSRWGTVKSVWEISSINDLLLKMPWRNVFPYATSRREAELMGCQEFTLQSHHDKVPLLAFEVTLD
jgi:hypothetical protein